MTNRYKKELTWLPETYRNASTCDVQAFERLVWKIQRGPAVFVGSGGALAVAQAVAEFHRQQTGQLGVAMTPLEVVAVPPLTGTSIVLFSAGARHPDVALALNHAQTIATVVGLVTCQDLHRIGSQHAGARIEIVSVPSPKDGFLATNSVLAMIAAASKTYGYELPMELPWLTKAMPEPVRSECVVLFGPRHRAVALDLEARLSETGLSSAQYADFRNFAHGRHVGFEHRIDQVSVVAFISPDDRKLADRTLRRLPTRSHQVTLDTELSYPGSVVDLIAASSRLVDVTADMNDMDPGRPGVPEFGRKLYHLSAQRLVARPSNGPIDRKMRAAGLGPGQRSIVEQALTAWLEKASLEVFKGLVLDYDGTCCFTDARFEPPPVPIRESLVALLESGIPLGFASGRGRSLLETTREWVPEPHWAQVQLGMYNATVLTRLDDPLDDAFDDVEGLLADAAARLKGLDLFPTWDVQVRRTQVTIYCSSRTGEELLPDVLAILARYPAINCRVVASAHSVDVLAPDATKALLVQRIGERVGGSVMAIGDQGQPGGNDFDLLASTPWSLTVDTCSPDLTRCWNLSRSHTGGPDLLADYLEAIRVAPDGCGFRFAWGRE